MTALETGLLLLATISIIMTRWRPGLVVLFVYFLFSLTWYHAIRALINGNAVILVGLLVTLSLWAIMQNKDEMAGVLLGLATIKPQVVFILWIFITIWAVSTRRWKLLAWSYGTVIVLTMAGIALIPDWILQNIYEVTRYPGYNPPGTVTAVLYEWMPGIGRQLGWGLTIILTIILLIEWRQVAGKNTQWFIWTACLTLVLTQWIGIQTDPGNFIVLFFPLVYVIVNLERRWGKNARLVTIIILAGLGVGLWYLFLSTLVPGEQPLQHSIMFFPVPLICLIGLYWIRWWAIRVQSSLSIGGV
jgi:Gpi18-like mannosyltransferase